MRIPTLLRSLLLLPAIVSVSASQSEQTVMHPDSQSPPIYVPQTTPQPTLADLLTIEPSASIFYSYARELEMSAMLSDQSARITLFVPTNKAVMALARKPHEGPETKVEIGLSEEHFHERAKKNVERWVSAHIVPEYPLSLDSNKHPTLLHGKSISFMAGPKTSGGAPWNGVKLNGEIKIIGKKEGLNGDLYLIDGTISTD